MIARVFHWHGLYRIAWLALFSATAIAGTADAGEVTVELTVGQQRVQGAPLRWSNREVVLLGRDGRLWSIAPKDVKGYRKASSTFQAYRATELRGQLQREFGNAFEVSGTGHYVVVHPRGRRDLWARRFEDLFRSFVHYFTARGRRPTDPRFPLIAIVFPNQSEFLRYAAKQGSQIPGSALGYYSVNSNRIMLYDVTGGSSQSDWTQNGSTIIHEATHQIAFNTGIHNRYSTCPTWVAEGLATMFEAKGVWSSREYPRRKDRVHSDQLRLFRQMKNIDKPSGRLEAIVQRDDLFRTNSREAYATAWALTFFLTETRPRDYLTYVQLTASRPAFEPYTASQRLSDFTKVFGNNLPVLEAHWLRFIKSL